MEGFIECILDCTTDLPGWEYTDTQKFYLYGGCYELAKIIKHFIPEAELLINSRSDHCAILYNDIAYDATGEIDMKDFHIATKEDIDYMEERFGLPEYSYIKGKPFIENVIDILNNCNLDSLLPNKTKMKN